MIFTIINLKEPLTYIYHLMDNKKYKIFYLTKKEWGFLNYLKEIFKIFNKPFI